jgi:HD domain
MPKTAFRAMSVATWAALIALGAVLYPSAKVSLPILLAASILLLVAQTVSVPAPSGGLVYLGLGVAAAVPMLTRDVVSTFVIFSMGMAGAWMALTIFKEETVSRGSEFVAEVVALGAFGLTYHGVDGALVLFEGSSSVEVFVSIVAAGLAWYITRAALRSLIGLERGDLSVRFLWLLALEDWTVVVSLLASGAIFGFTFPSMGWWALPISVMPYLFSHSAFVRYHQTRVTYGQTIRALAQIPEVAGLAPSGHSSRTGDLAVSVAREIGLHPDEVTQLEYAALMHDIGRITLNEPAILKAGYTDEDIAQWGSQIIAEAPYLEKVAEVVAVQHHPYRRHGDDADEEISMSSRIIKVVSAFDHATHEAGFVPTDALAQIQSQSDYEFDPKVAASLRRVLEHRGVISR